MTDMSAILKRYRALLEPAGPGGDEIYGREVHAARYADDAHALLPGTWFMGGHHQGRVEIDKMWEAVRVIWPEGTRLFRNHFFVGEDTLAIEWWSRNKVWNGIEARNSGVGRLRFRDDEVIDHYEITDSEYFEEIHGDWRGVLAPELGKFLPRWAQREGPYYPEPEAGDWNLHHSPTDGRKQIPLEMDARFEDARAWWAEPEHGSLDLFAEDVDVFFQGRLWPLGGHHRGQAALRRLCEVNRRLFPDGPGLCKTGFWADESRILVEWFSEKTLWDGREMRDGGFTVWEYRGDQVAAVRTYVDTSLYAEVLEGWREVVGEELGRTLPNWEPPSTPRYPRPSEHE